MNKENKFEFKLRGEKLILEIDKLSNKNEKSVVCRYGNTVVLTILTLKEVEKFNSFFPLNVIIRERGYSIGKIPKSFGKREGKSSNESITTSRIIDRSLRSLLPNYSKVEVKITNNILSFDKNYDPRIICILNSFLLCFLSNKINLKNAIAGIIIGKIENQLIINPNEKEKKLSDLELFVSSSKDKIVMLDGKAKELSEEILEKAIIIAKEEISEIILFFEKIKKQMNIKDDKEELIEIKNENLEKEIEKSLEILDKSNVEISWLNKEKELEKTRKILFNKNNNDEENYFLWNNSLRKKMKNFFEKGFRIDRRKFEEIREITIEANYLPKEIVHGSAFFKRGLTEVLSIVTIENNKKIKNDFEEDEIFIHHYNSNETDKKNDNVNKRETGHGELVEKSFNISKRDIFPYKIRVVSEVLSSDGSSSQASICSTSLALMTSGVLPFLKPVVGISLGLFQGTIISDINALEDKIGEMDFKISGNETGICSFQLDLKNDGIDIILIRKCLEKARKIHFYLLNKINKIKYDNKISKNVIKWKKINIDKRKIGLIIGAKGKTINKLNEENDSIIEIEDDGSILIYNKEEEKIIETENSINKLLKNY